MTTLRRFLVVQALLLWQGGFLFYAGVVVPAGTRLLGAAGQGAITARVTEGLNLIGAAALVILALELLFTRDPSRRRTAYRWAWWSIAAACQALLFYLHAALTSYMDADRRHVVTTAPFYPTHRVYLWTSSVMWFACLMFTWLTLRVWRATNALERPGSVGG